MKDYQQGTSGDDTLVGYNQEGGILLGGEGGTDVLRVAPNVGGDYTLDAHASASATLEGRDGDDVLLGSAGNDGMSGASGADILIGGAGNDSMLGGLGNDLLVGGAGVDRMGGGGGADVFAFKAGDNGMGAAARDVIVDFSAAMDKFQLSLGDSYSIGTVNPDNANSNTVVTITYGVDGSQGQVAMTSHLNLTASNFTFG